MLIVFGRSKTQVISKAIASLALGVVFALSLNGCSQLGRRQDRRLNPEFVESVVSRLDGFEGIDMEATLSVEHRNESLTVPLSVRVARGAVLEVRGEVSHFLLPFEGSFLLISDRHATALHTDLGVYELGGETDASTAIHAFLLSLVGGGDWLVWWLSHNGCTTGIDSECRGLRVKLEPHDRYASIERWEIAESRSDASFHGFINEYQDDALLPRIVTGIVYPQEITIHLEYDPVRGPGR
jgi:hypothetical protein